VLWVDQYNEQRPHQGAGALAKRQCKPSWIHAYRKGENDPSLITSDNKKGSALTMIVPGGGPSLDNARWIVVRSNFLVHVNVLARLFRGKMLAMLMDAYDAGELKFFNTHAGLADKTTFKRFIAPLRRIKWVVYCKAPFAGPEQVLRYLSPYTHRVAISNRRLVAATDDAIAFH
jgi:hypothetical protein